MGFAVPALRAAVWAAIQGWGGRLLSTAVFLLLARLLDPEAFGLVALALALLTVVQALVSFGLPDAIVRHERLEDAHVQSAFWAMMAFALVALVLAVVSAQAIAVWFHEPELGLVLAAIAIVLPVGVMDHVFDALLRRKFAFKALAIRKLASMSVASVLALVLAWLGAGVWSLVTRGLVEAFLGVVVLWTLSDWRPRQRFSRDHLRELFTFSAPMGVGRFVSLVSQSVDKWVIGYNLGAAQVGVYAIGQRLNAQVMDVFPETANRVLTSAFARLQSEPERLARAFLRAQQLASITTFPVFAGLLITAPDFIWVLLGPGWMESAPVVQILAVGGFCGAANYFGATAWVARGRSDWYLRWILFHSCLGVVAVLIGAKWGIVGVAGGYAIRGYLMLPIAMVLLKRSLGITAKQYFANLAGPAASTLTMAICVIGILWWLDGTAHPAVRLVVAFVMGVIAFLFACRCFAKKSLTDLSEHVAAAFPHLAKPIRMLAGSVK